jgi:DNA-binding sugar fermentation-stimulating protein
MPYLLHGNPAVVFSTVDISKSKRKYGFTLEMIQADTGAWVGIHSSLANEIALAMLSKLLVPCCQEFSDITKEVHEHFPNHTFATTAAV